MGVSDTVVDAEAPPAAAPAARVVPVLFGVTAFLSASLLFVVEPMVAKWLLPRFGGTPAVWNTSMVFFQAVLLLGYLYVHVSASILRARRQTVLHATVLGLALFALPLALPASDNLRLVQHPIMSLLGMLLAGVGLPFFALSASAPLLQRWLASLRHPSARDPYFLYAASNAGSFVGLLSYPILLEPALTLSEQARLWTAGYVALVVVLGACAWFVGTQSVAVESPVHIDVTNRPTTRRRLRWLLLAFVPSSLTLGVTTHVTTDVAAVPLLWVVPLSIYLLTFVFAFGRRHVFPVRWAGQAFPWLFAALLVNVFLGPPTQVWLSVPLHFLGLFVVGLLCHGQLAADRPDAQHLTDFYLWLSLGGVLGGIFNALVAPAVFTSVIEYPLVLAAAAFFQPVTVGRRKSVAVLLGVPLIVTVLIAIFTAVLAPSRQPIDWGIALGVCCLTALVWFGYSRKPWIFGAAALMIVVAGSTIQQQWTKVLAADRSFFGVYRILEKDHGRFHVLSHGTTLHGQEDRNAPTCEPLSYYSRTGPAGDVFSRLDVLGLTPGRVAVIGLGTGSLACYSKLGQTWVFYEIDPLVERIARTPGYFTFLSRAPSAIEVVQGDGRLSLETGGPAPYDVIVLDAFSSDAIPVHLLTAEAISLYLARLKPKGLLLFNISNRHLNLRPVVGCLAKSAGVAAFARADLQVAPKEISGGKTPSQWAALGRSPGAIDILRSARDWELLAARGGERCWTDDFSNVLTVLR